MERNDLGVVPRGGGAGSVASGCRVRLLLPRELRAGCESACKAERGYPTIVIMPAIDLLVLHLLNQFAHRSRLLDTVVVIMANANLLKGVVLMAILWGLWFHQTEGTTGGRTEPSERRARLIACCGVAILAVLIARLLAHVLPYRERPLHTSGIGYILPYTMEPQALIHWSSFPSDHAVLFFSLATGIYQVSRRCGVLALAHALVFIALPRLYLGIHWFTDILAGTALGIVLAWVGMRSRLMVGLKRSLDALIGRHPAVCYAAFFVLTYLIATLFDDARYIGSVLVHYLMGR